MLIILGIQYFLIQNVLGKFEPSAYYIQQSLFSLQLVTLFVSILQDPGVCVFDFIKDPTQKTLTCPDCQVTINAFFRVSHCLQCGICIRGYDHHCPWIGKCVGKSNSKTFKAFIYSTFAYMIFSVLSVFYNLMSLDD